ncbi:DNA repair protein RecO [Loigolactobacillus backii]|uniref:DNA repair protein RecO n=1 Tax=Loigolactobacillus backii TaxID=375175 RepID=A0A192H205_9LACO|nr:DNA repair protein RecO [Loigolactobacillus backii]ANK59594.1 DNA repair protein RecO [Loigolactobacillus backii]ANK62839.1 DNA repair protein RecO [Loigolactobacillus backii]ANK64588.1 DNA repair protein RecO [Loigolactobacillus backii]ANK67016.1 DNA repair protein RecO [Loigolactobacillus backii]ANK70153.1 DNA repair protein RecO [Loigolactobacillus backii]
MAQRQITDFNGLVMFRRDYRERDMLVKFFTDQFGKKMFFIRGARKRGFKLAAALLPFTQGTYVGNIHEEGLSFINAAKEYHQFQSISTDIGLNAYATYILNLIDVAFTDNQPLPRWYQQAVLSVQLIDDGFDPEIITNINEIQLLAAFGVAPYLESCVICHRSDLPLDYSESYGGLLCQKHFHLDPYRFHASARAIYLLRQFSVLNLSKLTSISVKQATKDELRRIIDRIYSDTVGLSLKSKHFIDDMKNWDHLLKP